MKDPLHQYTLGDLLRRQAQAHGARTFLRFEGRDYSYAEAWTVSLRIAGGLRAVGIQAHEHIAIMMENRPETVWLHFALALIGAVAVPVNNAARGDLLAYYVRQSDAVAMVLDAAFVDRFAAVHAQCPRLRFACVYADEETASDGTQHDALHIDGLDTLAWPSLAEAAAPPALPTARHDDRLHILYSSGTTGPSKGSMVAHATALLAAERYVETNGYVADDVMYTCLPMFHGNALNCTLLPALVAGATVALSRRFSTRRFWTEIVESGATHCSLLSAMIDFLWQLPPSAEERAHHLRVCLVVPAPSFATEFEQRYGVRIASLYSLSDFGLATVLSPHDPRDKLRSAGRPIPEMAVAILDEDDLPVAPGEVGEICLRNTAPWFGRQGYYRMADTFLAALRNLWFHTGDRGWLDTDGYLHFAGRNKELIRRRGENISALLVEDALRLHPAVAHAAVYAVRAEFAEDEVMATIVAKPGLGVTAADLITFCAPRLAYFMVPRFVEFVDELPYTPTGKVEKYKLRAAAEARLCELWDREKSGIVLEK